MLAFLSDNGSEFKGSFDALLQRRALTHYWTYPRCPKMNAHNERFNRSLQEQFVDFYEDFLFDNLNAFNRKLARWIVLYNTVIPPQRPHRNNSHCFVYSICSFDDTANFSIYS